MQRTRHGSLVALIAVAALAGCGGGSRVRLSVTPTVALMDSPVHVTVSGLRPHERVKARDGARSVALTADAGGRIDLTGDASLRLLWLLHPSGTGRMTIAVLGVRATIDRLARSPDVRVRRLRPKADGFYGDFFAPPPSSEARPGILVFGGSEGGLSTTAIAALYASHGYPTLALAYFAEPGLPKDLRDIPLEYFATALRWLARRPGVDPAKLVVEGGSRGSEAAQLLGIDYPRLVHAVIAMVPSNGAVCGITRFTGAVGSARCIGAAWTFRGKPVPYSLLGGPGTPYPFHDERIDGPVFLDCGGNDQLWPSCPMARAIVARLRRHRFGQRVTFLDYPRAGHGVGPLLPYPPGPLSSALEGSSPDSNVLADANGWPRLLTFLRSVADS
jgi:dienelactone hydrolase